MEFISLYRVNTKENLVKNLAEQGLIFINNDDQKCSTSLYEELQQAQSIAKSSHRGLWQYSDLIEDDANE
jgi:endonuclease YncB( thermonuclease family)